MTLRHIQGSSAHRLMLMLTLLQSTHSERMLTLAYALGVINNKLKKDWKLMELKSYPLNVDTSL